MKRDAKRAPWLRRHPRVWCGAAWGVPLWPAPCAAIWPGSILSGAWLEAVPFAPGDQGYAGVARVVPVIGVGPWRMLPGLPCVVPVARSRAVVSCGSAPRRACGMADVCGAVRRECGVWGVDGVWLRLARGWRRSVGLFVVWRGFPSWLRGCVVRRGQCPTRPRTPPGTPHRATGWLPVAPGCGCLTGASRASSLWRGLLRSVSPPPDEPCGGTPVTRQGCQSASCVALSSPPTHAPPRPARRSASFSVLRWAARSRHHTASRPPTASAPKNSPPMILQIRAILTR